MADFAKIFVVNGEQLLAFIEPDNDADDDQDSLILHQMIDVEGAVIDLKMRGSPEAIEAVFAKLDQQSAENFFNLELVQRLRRAAA